MNAALTHANLTRLLDCVRLDLELSAGAQPSMVLRDRPGAEAAPSAWDIRFTGLFETAEEARTIGFLGLLELAAAVGYVDFTAWQGTSALARAVERFVESLGTTQLGEPRLVGVRRLVARLQAPHAQAPTERHAFAAFESYLALTRSVFADRALIEALVFTHSRWRPGADTAALLSPRHFAEALATGRVGAVRMPGFSGMPRCLQALEQLVAILERVRDRDDLYDLMLAHAHWSHAAWILRERADEWAVAMSEWTAPRDLEGEARWMEFRTRVFRTLTDAQLSRRLYESSNPFVEPGLLDHPDVPWSIVVAPAKLDAWVAEMLAAGRDEAARRTLRAALERLAAQLESLRPDDRMDDLERLVSLARRLAGLGDADSAAAFVAPHALWLQRSMSGSALADEALRLVAEARRCAAVEDPPSGSPAGWGAPPETTSGPGSLPSRNRYSAD